MVGTNRKEFDTTKVIEAGQVQKGKRRDFELIRVRVSTQRGQSTSAPGAPTDRPHFRHRSWWRLVGL